MPLERRPAEHMKGFHSILLILVITALNIAGDLATSFKEASAVAESQDKDAAAKAYVKHDLGPYYEKKYSSVIQSCLSSTVHFDRTPFSFIVAIGTDGRVLRLYNDHGTNIFACLKQTLEKDQFPHPPFSPYYWHVEMSFRQKNDNSNIHSRNRTTKNLSSSRMIMHPAPITVYRLSSTIYGDSDGKRVETKAYRACQAVSEQGFCDGEKWNVSIFTLTKRTFG